MTIIEQEKNFDIESCYGCGLNKEKSDGDIFVLGRLSKKDQIVYSVYFCEECFNEIGGKELADSLIQHGFQEKV